jgi:hypothetical protein
MGKLIVGLIIGVVAAVILCNVLDGPIGLLGLGAGALGFLGG